MRKIYLLSAFFVLLMIRVIAQPASPATTPTRNASDVVSLFSEAYTDISTTWHPSWGQTTVLSDFTVAGNVTKKLTNFGYEGITTSAVNLTTMTSVHVDIYSVDESSIKIYLLITGEPNVTKTLIAGQWNSFDIPLTDFGSGSKAAVTGLKVESGTYTWPNGVSTVYLDNIYFWKPAPAAGSPTITGFSVPAKLTTDAPFTISAPSSNSAGAFTYTSSNLNVATIIGNQVTIAGAGTSTITATQAADGSYLSGSVIADLIVTYPPPATAATAPTKSAADVISLFSNTYTNSPITSWNPNWDMADLTDIQIAGNDVKKYTNFVFAGVDFPVIDASSMGYLHVDIYSRDASNFKIKLVDFGADGLYGGNFEHEITRTPSNTTDWVGYDIPLSEFIGLTERAHLAQMILSSSNTTVYVDNIYFWKAASLPVSLSDFKASKNGNSITLNWKTESESNNKGFVIERSANGIEWTQIQFVNGNGTTASAKYYSTRDNNPLNGLNYYRLIQVDNDGKQTNSDVLSVKFSLDQQIKLSFYPNPAKNSLTVHLGKVENNDAALELINFEGKKINTFRVNKQDSNQNKTLDLKGFDKGIYLLILKDGLNSKASKLLID
jgi:hypothetical protein